MWHMSLGNLLLVLETSVKTVLLHLNPNYSQFFFFFRPYDVIGVSADILHMCSSIEKHAFSHTASTQ